MLEANGLSVMGQQRPRLDDVSVRLLPSQVVVLLGENGAGKSTLLDCLSGITRPDTGRVTLDGTPLDALSPQQRAMRIASLGQRDTGAGHLLVAGRIAQGLSPRRGPSALLDDVTSTRVMVIARELGVDELEFIRAQNG
ncbi:MAG: ATP-binding cassette domain-containing protein [Myxococcota bacterium]